MKRRRPHTQIKPVDRYVVPANLQAKRRAAAAAEAKPASWLASAHSLAEGRPALEVWQHIASMVRLAKHLAGVVQTP